MTGPKRAATQRTAAARTGYLFAAASVVLQAGCVSPAYPTVCNQTSAVFRYKQWSRDESCCYISVPPHTTVRESMALHDVEDGLTLQVRMGNSKATQVWVYSKEEVAVRSNGDSLVIECPRNQAEVGRG